MLLTRVMPLISVFAAFSFVVMMFNLPLPGGTTGHALGVTIAAIVLGPVGRDSGHLHRACHSGAVLRRWRHHARWAPTASTWRSSASLVAYASLPADRGRLGHRFAPPRGGRRHRRLSGHQRGGAVLRPSSSAFSRCCFTMPRGAPLYAPYPLQHRHSRHDDRPSHLRGPWRSRSSRPAWWLICKPPIRRCCAAPRGFAATPASSR